MLSLEHRMRIFNQHHTSTTLKRIRRTRANERRREKRIESNRRKRKAEIEKKYTKQKKIHVDYEMK